MGVILNKINAYHNREMSVKKMVVGNVFLSILVVSVLQINTIAQVDIPVDALVHHVAAPSLLLVAEESNKLEYRLKLMVVNHSL